MITRELLPEDKNAYNELVNHPLQSWEWGEFREKMGIRVIRVGTFEDKRLVSGYQLTLHPIPFTNFSVGYFPKGPLPTLEMIESLQKIGREYNCIFIKLEPNVTANSSDTINTLLLIPSSKPLFTKYTFELDLTKTEEELLKNMHPKTRYNIKIAQKHGVTIQEENTEEAFTAYLSLTHETSKRQGFYAHNTSYHQLLWETLRPAGIAHLFTARFQGKILATWMLFLFKQKLYYPYGASSETHKEVMASNLIMWETMRWGKLNGAKVFDLWGTPGPNPNPTDPYYGFHRFKLGYGPQLVEFMGTYDLVLKQPHYQIFSLIDTLRWAFLKAKARL